MWGEICGLDISEGSQRISLQSNPMQSISNPEVHRSLCQQDNHNIHVEINASADPPARTKIKKEPEMHRYNRMMTIIGELKTPVQNIM
jgi:hypothetical protein